MAQYRSAQGKIIDMTALAAKNEKVRAVGNMKVNARGDTIDAHGKVVIPVTQKVGAAYEATVGHRNAQAKKSKNQTTKMTKEEIELQEFDELSKDIEEIKSKEMKK
jgi:predicted amidohydrolase